MNCFLLRHLLPESFIEVGANSIRDSQRFLTVLLYLLRSK